MPIFTSAGESAYQKHKRAAAESALSVAKNWVCKNAILILEPKTEKNGLKTFAIRHDKAGCGNARRAGSAYCQACSDAHNALN